MVMPTNPEPSSDSDGLDALLNGHFNENNRAPIACWSPTNRKGLTPGANAIAAAVNDQKTMATTPAPVPKKVPMNQLLQLIIPNNAK